MAHPGKIQTAILVVLVAVLRGCLGREAGLGFAPFCAPSTPLAAAGMGCPKSRCSADLAAALRSLREGIPGPIRHRRPGARMHVQGWVATDHHPLLAGEVMDELIAAAYPSSNDGFCTTEEEEASIDKVSGDNAHTYGEITPQGFRDLCRRLNVGRGDVFMDLGSGVGKAVLQARLEFGAARSVGVELSSSRHRNAVKGARTLAAEASSRGLPTGLLPPPPPPAFAPEAAVVECGAGVRFVRGDVAEADVGGATVVYVASLCFSEDFMVLVGRKLSAEGRALRAVASLKRFEEGLEGFRECDPDEEQYRMSWMEPWGATTSVWVYLRE